MKDAPVHRTRQVNTMTFRTEILVQGELAAAVRTSELDLHLDGPLSSHDELVRVLDLQCRVLAATGAISFRVSGFGDHSWPVDVATDLPVALEQLPSVLAGLRHESAPFQWNFYEQGIERYLTGTRRGSEVSFECLSMSGRWTANPTVEVIPLHEAEKMFRELRTRYAQIVERVCPWLARLPPFKRWETAEGSVDS